jgi:hypothetical protein
MTNRKLRRLLLIAGSLVLVVLAFSMAEYRAQYLDEIRQGINLDVMHIREQNKKEDYVSRREAS